MNKNTGEQKMKTKRYTLETYPTDFWGAYTVIYDNEKDRYYVENEKGWGGFNSEVEHNEAKRFGKFDKFEAEFYVAKWNKGDFRGTPLDTRTA